MLDFNLWTWNSRAFPGIDPLVCRLGDKVRIRIGNLTMTNHPIPLHGHEFVVTGTDRGWNSPGSRWPEVTADIAVGQMRNRGVRRHRPGRLGFPLPQVAPHHESDGPRRTRLAIEVKGLAEGREIVAGPWQVLRDLQDGAPVKPARGGKADR